MGERVTATLLVVLLVLAGLLLVSCGGPQDSPESVARAFSDALVTGDCGLVEKYMTPDRKDLTRNWCGESDEGVRAVRGSAPTFVRIDNVVVRDTDIWGSPGKEVKLIGEFHLYYGDTADKMRVVVEKLNGKWYVWWWEREW